MNRRTRTIIVVAVAILLASLASFGVYRAIRNIPRVEVPIATNFAVVAKDRIPVGVLITAEMVKRVPWPADTPVPASFSQPTDVVGRGVIDAFAANEPITEDKLAPKNMGGGLPPQIPQGMRAMSVRVNDVVAVAGFTGPGTRVDVLVTLKTQNNDPISRVVLSNVQVLTANTKYEVEKSQQGQSMPITIVTFLLTPQDAEKLALAQTQGQIMLALRNPLDILATETQGARLGSLFGAPAPPPVRTVVKGQTRMVPPPPPPPPPPPNTVEMVRAGKKGEVIIKK